MKYLILSLLVSTTVTAAQSVSFTGFSELTGDKCSVNYQSNGRSLSDLKISGDAKIWGIMGNIDNPLSAYEKTKNINIELGKDFLLFPSLFTGRDSVMQNRSKKISLNIDGSTLNPDSVEVVVTNYARFIQTGITTYKCIR